jgi:hypothetical protein
MDDIGVGIIKAPRSNSFRSPPRAAINNELNDIFGGRFEEADERELR